MSKADRMHWDDRYSERGMAAPEEQGQPRIFGPFEHLFPTEGDALELACGTGGSAVWLARRGMEVWAVDVSPVAIDLARKLAAQSGVADRCQFDVVDLDDGLPHGATVDLLMCHLFRAPRLYRAMAERVTPGGLLAVAVLSEVGIGPGEFRARPGELRDAFTTLDALAHGEEDGLAWILARPKLGEPTPGNGA